MENSFEKLSLDLFFYLRDLIRNKHSSCDFISKSSILKSINQQTKITTTKASSSGFPKRKLFSLKLFLIVFNFFLFVSSRGTQQIYKKNIYSKKKWKRRNTK